MSAVVRVVDLVAGADVARHDAIASATRSRTVAATTVARMAAAEPDDPGHRKEGRNLDLPPWQKGRYGTAIGRAVHAVLQTVDLNEPTTVDAAAAAQAAAEGETPQLIDLSLTPDAQAGDWVLTFLGAAREVLDPSEAAKISAALEARARLRRTHLRARANAPDS